MLNNTSHGEMGDDFLQLIKEASPKGKQVIFTLKGMIVFPASRSRIFGDTTVNSEILHCERSSLHCTLGDAVLVPLTAHNTFILIKIPGVSESRKNGAIRCQLWYPRDQRVENSCGRPF